MKTIVRLLVLILPLSAQAEGVTLPDVERVVLDNGTVLLLNEKHDVPLIGMEIVLRGGASVDPADKYGAASLLAGLLTKGAGQRNAAEFADTVAGVGGELDVSASLESITVSAEFLAKDVELMVELVSDVLLRPTLDRREFAKLRDRTIDLIKAAKGGNPGGLMSDYTNAFLFGTHPYGNPVDGSEASLAGIDHSDMLRLYEAQLGGDRLIVSVSGDFDAESMRTLLSEALGEWRPGASGQLEIPVPPRAQAGRVLLINKPGSPQTFFRFGNIGVSLAYARRAELDLIHTVFGGRFTSMLNQELRVKTGLTYGARAALTRNGAGGSMMVSSYTQTDKTEEAIGRALDILGRLHADGLSDEIRLSAKNYILGQYPPRFETASQLATQFAFLEAFELGAGYVNDYGDALESTTSESLASVIEDVYPQRDDLVFVLLGDAEQIRDYAATLGEVTEISINDPFFHAPTP